MSTNREGLVALAGAQPVLVGENIATDRSDDPIRWVSLLKQLLAYLAVEKISGILHPESYTTWGESVATAVDYGSFT